MWFSIAYGPAGRKGRRGLFSGKTTTAPDGFGAGQQCVAADERRSLRSFQLPVGLEQRYVVGEGRCAVGTVERSGHPTGPRPDTMARARGIARVADASSGQARLDSRSAG